MRKLRYVKKIIRNSPHNLSYLRVVVVGVGQLLEMIISIPSHIRLDFGSHDVTHVLHIMACHSVNDTQYKIKDAQLYNNPHRQGGQILNSLIGNITHNQRQYQFTDSS